MRKIVQIAMGSDGYFEGAGGSIGSYTTALCNDGTVWQIGYWDKGWQRLPDIPQEAAHED